MSSWPRTRPTAAGVLASLLAILACRDMPSATDGTPCCSSSVDPIFLKSKIDDDDGDGNPVDEDFPSVNDEDDDIADHAWFRDSKRIYHLFFQNEDHGFGDEIEHYTSIDLKNLAYVGLALRKNPGG